MDKKKLRLVTFGDSITMASEQEPEKRWPALVRDGLSRQFPEMDFGVINAGVGGNTSREGLARIKVDVLAHDADIVTVEFGGNDATPEESRHVSFEEFEQNLDTMKQLIQQRRRAAMVILPFPPVIEEQHCWFGNPFYDELGGQDPYINVYRNISRRFAEKNDLALADIDKALKEKINQEGWGEYILPDGVHLTGKGNRVVAEAVLEAVKPLVAL